MLILTQYKYKKEEGKAMKKGKVIGTLLFSSLFFFYNVSSASAEESIDINEEEVVLEEDEGLFAETYPLQINENEVLNFFSEEDREFYINQNMNSDTGISTRSTVKTRDTFISSKRYYGKFLGYSSLTPNWSYASGYILSKGKNVTFTTGYTYEGVSASLTISQSYGVSINIPANSSRSNRLAAKGDVTISKYKVEAYYGNTVTKTFYVLRSSKPSNITNYVQYR